MIQATLPSAPTGHGSLPIMRALSGQRTARITVSAGRGDETVKHHITAASAHAGPAPGQVCETLSFGDAAPRAPGDAKYLLTPYAQCSRPPDYGAGQGDPNECSRPWAQ